MIVADITDKALPAYRLFSSGFPSHYQDDCSRGIGELAHISVYRQRMQELSL